MQAAETKYKMAYRAWVLYGDRLESVIMSDPFGTWLPLNPLPARCYHAQDQHAMLTRLEGDDRTPRMDCSCGYYSFKNPKSLKQMIDHAVSRTMVFGRVAIWGHYVEAEEGYKSQYAYPQVLYYGGKNPLWKRTREELVPVAERYGCELLPMPEDVERELDTMACRYIPMGDPPVAWGAGIMALIAYGLVLWSLVGVLNALQAHNRIAVAFYAFSFLLNLNTVRLWVKMATDQRFPRR